MTTKSLTNLEDLEISEQKIKELKKRKSELLAETWLSPREAEIYLLFKEENYDELQEVADELDITRNTVYKHWRNVKDKVLKSKETSKLEVF